MRQALVRRLKEMVRKRESLSRQSARLLELAQAEIEHVGFDARIVGLMLEPQDFFYPETPLGRRYFILSFENLGSDLQPKIRSRFVRIQRDVRDILRRTKPLQIWRHRLLEERRARPGFTKIDAVAASLLEAAGLTAAQWIAGAAMPASLTVNGARLDEVTIYRDHLQIRAAFRFDGGLWNEGVLTIDQVVPETVQQALRGRPISDAVQGGVFDRTDASIVASETMADTTRFGLAVPMIWVPEA